MIIVPIGIQCTNAVFKKRIGKATASLPFDWMFAPPHFVYEMLKLLLEDNMEVEQLVNEHFFNCDARLYMKEVEHYFVSDTGNALYNSKYDAVFPHDTLCKENTDKYIRRFKRLKEYILDSTVPICFIYSTPSSSTNGNFTIDGRQIQQDLYSNMTKIYNLVNKFRTDFQLILFDSSCDKTTIHELDGRITHVILNECKHWSEMVNQMCFHHVHPRHTNSAPHVF